MGKFGKMYQWNFPLLVYDRLIMWMCVSHYRFAEQDKSDVQQDETFAYEICHVYSNATCTFAC